MPSDTEPISEFPIFTETPGIVPNMHNNASYLEEHPRAWANQWQRHPMTEKEVDVYLSTVIAMGIVGLPTIR